MIGAVVTIETKILNITNLAASLYIKRENTSLPTDTSHLKTFLIQHLIISHKSSQILSSSNEMRDSTSCTSRTSCTTWQSPPPPPHDNFAHKVALSRCKFTNVHANEMQFYYVIRHTINILHLPLKWNEWQKLFKKRRNCNLINKCIALILETAIFVIFL